MGFSKKLVTSVQGNGKFLLQWSVLRNDFEVRCHNVELDCIATAKKVNSMLRDYTVTNPFSIWTRVSS